MVISDKPNHYQVVGAVAITVLFSLFFAIIATSIFFDVAAKAYVVEHNLKPLQHSFLIFSWEGTPVVTIDMVGWGRVILVFLVASISWGLIHPFIGRAISSIASNLGNAIDNVFDFPEENRIGSWTSGVSLMFGTL